MLPEEEQIALLGKMLLNSVDQLTDREREVYDVLVEGLTKRVNRMQRLERQTERLKKKHGQPDPDMGEDDQSKKHIVRNLRPDEVIRLFLESWNNAEFDTEYFCLSQSCRKGGRDATPFPDYIQNRRTKWEDRDIAGIIRKRLCEVSSSEMRGNRAVVHCVEAHTTATEETTLCREYQLIYEEGGWRIIDFSTRRRLNRPHSSKPS